VTIDHEPLTERQKPKACGALSSITIPAQPRVSRITRRDILMALSIRGCCPSGNGSIWGETRTVVGTLDASAVIEGDDV